MDMRVHKPFCEFSKTSHPSVGYKEGFTNKLLQLACENRAVDGPSHFPPLTSYQTVQAHYLLRVTWVSLLQSVTYGLQMSQEVCQKDQSKEKTSTHNPNAGLRPTYAEHLLPCSLICTSKLR